MQLSAGGRHTGVYNVGKGHCREKKVWIISFLQSEPNRNTFILLLLPGWLSVFLRNGQWKQISNRQNYYKTIYCRIILKMVLRDEVHSVSVVFDALLPIFGEIPQHLQRPHADGDVILVCPDLQSNEHHTCVQLLFEDLPLKQREFLIVETERCSIATTGRQGLLNTLITQS